MAERCYAAPRCAYQIIDGRIQTDGTYHAKISGTSLGAILGVNNYLSPFSASARILGLWDEDISDKPAIVTGRALEEPIIEYLATHHSDVGNFFKVEELPFEARVGEHDKWVSDFEDDVFAGHIDGIVSKDGQDYILEIKTANRDRIERTGDWVTKGVPQSYLWQVYLYNHFLTKQDKAYFGLGIVDAHTYENPRMWRPNKENCRLFEVRIDQDMVARKLDEVRRLYGDTILKGTTVCDCDPGNEDDVRLLTHLTDIKGNVDDLNTVIAEYTELKARNKAHMDAIKDSLKEEDVLKSRVLDMMTTWNLNSAGNVRIQTQNRRTFDWKAADAAGLDYSQFEKTTTVNILKVKE